MSRKVHTREIMEALEIDSTPLTHDLMLEREQAIEQRWLEQFRDLKDTYEKRATERAAFEKAKAEIADAALSALHNKNVVVPSLYGPPGVFPMPTEPDHEAKLEIINNVVTYITMGRDFEVIIQAIKDNPLLMSEWERFLLSLRMAQAD